MTFTVRGRWLGELLEVTWSDGGLVDGDTLAVDLVNARLRDPYPVEVTATGPYLAPALEPDYVALATIGEAFDEVVDVTGERPTVPDPDGAGPDAVY